MLKRHLKMLVISGLAGLSGAVFAAGGGHGGGMGGGHEGGLSSGNQSFANSNGLSSADRDKGSMRATDRMNAEGLSHERATTHTATRHHAGSRRALNANNRTAADRDKGLQRAEDRAKP